MFIGTDAPGYIAVAERKPYNIVPINCDIIDIMLVMESMKICALSFIHFSLIFSLSLSSFSACAHFSLLCLCSSHVFHQRGRYLLCTLNVCPSFSFFFGHWNVIFHIGLRCGSTAGLKSQGSRPTAGRRSHGNRSTAGRRPWRSRPTAGRRARGVLFLMAACRRARGCR